MTDIRELIAAERRELATILEDLPEASWLEPTLCEGWRVREVVAHMTMPFRYSHDRFAKELERSGGDFNLMADRTARSDPATPAELAACLRENVTHPWQPPGGGYEGALTHDVVHGLDFTVPLGIERHGPGDRLRIVLDGLASPRGREFFGVDLDGVELRADDLDWSYGSGTPVTGAARDLVLLLAGRKLPKERFS
jgi:uncharacterized protein (TIGR03083 family)